MTNTKMNEEALENVAGGMRDVTSTGSKVGGNQTVYDESKTNIEGSTVHQGDEETVCGDKTGGNKTDVKTDVKTKVDVKNSIF